MSIHSDDAHEPRVGTYPPYGDNLEGNLPEEDGVDQRAEPPSWLPEGGRSRTGAAADLRSPEADEATTGTQDGDSGYDFAGSTSYSDSQDTTFGQQDGRGRVRLDRDPTAMTLARRGTPPRRSRRTRLRSLSRPVARPRRPAPARPVPTRPARPSSADAADGLGAPARDDGRNRTSTFSAVTRGRYKGGSGSSAAGPSAAGAAVGGGAAAAAVAPRRRPGRAARPRPGGPIWSSPGSSRGR